MKKLNPDAYRTLFFKHVTKFIEAIARPTELMGSHAIAVSGGCDSMTLLWVAACLRKIGEIGQIRAIFIHHHTRPSQDDDQFLVEQFCKNEGIPFSVLHAKGLDSETGNFEGRARVIRRELLVNGLSQGELLWLGHHLNDSYEWAVMQRNRSSRDSS